MKINLISKEIDRILECESGWTNTELQFFQMLQEKVEKYGYRIKSAELNADRNEFIEAVQDRTWFQNSKNQSSILNLIKTMDILDVGYSSSGGFKLDIKFRISKSTFMLKARYSEKDGRKYCVFLENDRGKAYISQFGFASGVAPDIDAISGVAPTKNIGAKELIKLSGEIIYFYNDSLAKLPISEKLHLSLLDLCDTN